MLPRKLGEYPVHDDGGQHDLTMADRRFTCSAHRLDECFDALLQAGVVVKVRAQKSTDVAPGVSQLLQRLMDGGEKVIEIALVTAVARPDQRMTERVDE